MPKSRALKEEMRKGDAVSKKKKSTKGSGGKKISMKGK